MLLTDHIIRHVKVEIPAAVDAVPWNNFKTKKHWPSRRRWKNTKDNRGFEPTRMELIFKNSEPKLKIENSESSFKKKLQHQMACQNFKTLH